MVSFFSILGQCLFCSVAGIPYSGSYIINWKTGVHCAVYIVQCALLHSWSFLTRTTLTSSVCQCQHSYGQSKYLLGKRVWYHANCKRRWFWTNIWNMTLPQLLHFWAPKLGVEYQILRDNNNVFVECIDFNCKPAGSSRINYWVAPTTPVKTPQTIFSVAPTLKLVQRIN